MSTAVTPVAAVHSSGDVARSPVGDIGRPAVARPASEPSPDLRLVIEEDEASGAFVYKTLDRTTGEVIRQLPREEVLRMRSDDAYEAGDIFDGLA